VQKLRGAREREVSAYELRVYLQIGYGKIIKLFREIIYIRSPKLIMKKPKAFEWFGMLKFLYQKKPKAFEWFGMLKFLYHAISSSNFCSFEKN
jgi:hypothetical protein